MGSVEYPAMSTENVPAEVLPYIEAMNWQSQRIAQIHGMVVEMYQVFEALKPLVNNMPKMPSGIQMPPGINFPYPGR